MSLEDQKGLKGMFGQQPNNPLGERLICKNPNIFTRYKKVVTFSTPPSLSSSSPLPWGKISLGHHGFFSHCVRRKPVSSSSSISFSRSSPFLGDPPHPLLLHRSFGRGGGDRASLTNKVFWHKQPRESNVSTPPSPTLLKSSFPYLFFFFTAWEISKNSQKLGK